MWDFSLSNAMRAVLRTAPFVVLRLVVYVGIALTLMLTTGFGAGLAFSSGAQATAITARCGAASRASCW